MDSRPSEETILGVVTRCRDLQTVQKYSSMGLTGERYAAVFVDSLLTFKFLLMKPNIRFPFLIAWSICLFQDMLDWSSTSRYRVESSVASTCHFNEYSVTTKVLDLDTLSVLHLSGSKDIPHFFSQDGSWWRSFAGCHSFSGSLSFCRRAGYLTGCCLGGHW